MKHGWLGVVALCAWWVGAPEAAAQSNLRIVAAGGLVGQLEGFCERPGGPFDEQAPTPGLAPCAPPAAWPAWLGGALGVAGWKSASYDPVSVPTSWFLIAPNNQIPDFPLTQNPIALATNLVVRQQRAAQRAAFWNVVTSMNPDAVAFGPDDFLRSLRTLDGATLASPTQAFVAWLRSAGPRFLASNVAVRLRGNLQAVQSQAGVMVLGAEDESVPWTSAVKLELACGAMPPVVVEEHTARPTSSNGNNLATGLSPSVRPASPGCVENREVVLARPLRPGRWYRIQVGAEVATFRTDDALMDLTGPLSEDGVSLFKGATVTAALVDPGTAGLIGSELRKWTGAGCPARECELVFLDPAAALTAIVKRREASTKAVPAAILVSALTDEQTTAVLEKHPMIKAVVLAPDSLLLGRAYATDDMPTGFSGDLGLTAIVDGDLPVSTRIMVRPEWWGETAGVLNAQLTACTSARGCGSGPTLDNESARIVLVPGAPLTTTVVSREVTYRAQLGSSPSLVVGGPYPSYSGCAPAISTGDCPEQRGYWSSPESFGNVVAEALRRDAGAELAIVPVSIVDGAYTDWVSSRIGAAGTDWLSRYVMERALYRHPPMVRSYVTGATMASTLQKIFEADSAEKFCVAGLNGGGCPASVDKEHPERLLVNGRRVDTRLWYSVVMPAALADTLDIKHDDRSRDPVDAIDRLFLRMATREQAGPPPPSDTLLQRSRRRRLPSAYALFSPVEVGVAKITVRNPEGKGDLRANLDFPTAKVEPATTWSINAGVDLAPYDGKWFAVRFPGRIQYVKRVEDKGDAMPAEVTYEKDEYEFGVRADAKLHLGREVRLFGGWFQDGSTNAKLEREVKASRPISGREGVTTTESVTLTTPLTFKPSQFTQRRVGFDVIEISKLPLGGESTLSIKTFGFHYAWGTMSNITVGAALDGAPLDRTLALSRGLGTALTEYFKAGGTVMAASVYAPIQEPRDRHRLQFDNDVELGLKVNDWDWTYNLITRYRRFRKAEPYTLSDTFRLTNKLTLPAWDQVKLTLEWEYDIAATKSDPAANIVSNRFSSHRIDVKLSLPGMVKWGRGLFIR